MKQIVISILKTIFKIIKAVLCVAGVAAVILSFEVTKNIIKDKENGDTNDSQEISIEVSGKIPVQQVEQENDNNKQHFKKHRSIRKYLRKKGESTIRR